MISISNNSLLLLLSGLLLFGLLAGCSSDSGTATGSAELTVSATNAARVASLSPLQRMWQLLAPSTAHAVTGLKDIAGHDVILTDFQISVREVKLKHEEDDDASGMDEDSVDFPGPFAVDLLNDAGDPVAQTIGNADIPVGNYDGIRFVMHKDAATAAPLTNRSVYIAGKVTISPAPPADFVMWHDTGENFDFFGPNPIVVDQNGINNLMVDFKLMSVIGAVDFAPSGGLTDINPNSADDANTTIAHALKNAIKEAADFGEDHDHDDVLGENEDVD